MRYKTMLWLTRREKNCDTVSRTFDAFTWDARTLRRVRQHHGHQLVVARLPELG
ncbi:hypothetical protein ACFC8F_32685 [Streptomyces hydrogenans]|uniref:hypothetical protein n=1 Tax=Streptomyces hydrogenans TaxID=1873719 RepID=UPI0035D9A2DB